MALPVVLCKTQNHDDLMDSCEGIIIIFSAFSVALGDTTFRLELFQTGIFKEFWVVIMACYYSE